MLWTEAITAGIYDRWNGVRPSFCAATILRTECLLWVKSGHHALQQKLALFDHLVGRHQQVLRERDAESLSPIQRLNALPIPTVALVQGVCFGGGTGMIAVCDIVIAADDAVFSIAEVRIGVAGTIIVPQLNDAIGVRQVRRYALTAERFDVKEAYRIGLVHEIVPIAELQTAGERIVGHLLANGPEAITQTKACSLRSAWSNLKDDVFAELIESHAAKRQSEEAAEGLASFLEKRPARWNRAQKPKV